MAVTRARGSAELVASRTEVSAFLPGPDDYGRRARTFPGLGFQTAWLWAAVTADDDGRRFALMREHNTASTVVYTGIEVAPDVWAPPAVHRAPAPGLDRQYWGPLFYEQDGDGHIVRSTNHAYPALTARLAPDGHHWVEHGWLDLTMRPLGHALRFVCPGPPDAFGITSQICRVTGTVEGAAVTGFGGLDRHYGEPGVGWTQSKGFRHLEQFWWVWAGLDADGRQEHGTAVAGPNEFAVGFFDRDGDEPVATNHLDHDIEWQERDGRRIPVAAGLRLGGRHFRFVANGNVSFPDPALGIDWLHGGLFEDSGPRLVAGFAWMEYFKHLATSGAR
jgi:hypothetical protein